MTRTMLFLALTMNMGCGADDTGAQDTGVVDTGPSDTASVDTGEPPDTSVGNKTVILVGAVEKGPFILGSSVDISPVDALGEPTGQVFQTSTLNDLGEFNVRFEYEGLSSIEAQGFYYNEITGDLSAANLTLRAFYQVSDVSNQSAYVNLLTHLVYGRIKQLLSENIDFSVASIMAENELYAALGVGPAQNTLGASGVQTNMLSGDSDPSAYLLAVSSVIVKAAQLAAVDSGSVDAQLQQLLNTLSVDLADDGEISSALTEQLNEAQRALQPSRVVDLFKARLDSLGLSATVPDMGRFIDTDADGVMNASDSCPLIANPDQSVFPNGLCDARVFTASDLFGNNGFTLGVWDFEHYLSADLDDDGYNEPLIYLSDGTDTVVLTAPLDPNFGFKSTPVQTVLPVNVYGSASFYLAADLSGDGLADLLVHGTPLGGAGPTTFLMKGLGDGSFAAATVIANLDLGSLGGGALSDYDGDGQLDLFLSVEPLVDPGVWVALGNGDGSFSEPKRLHNHFGTLHFDDLNADGRADLVINQDGLMAILLMDGQGGYSSRSLSFEWEGNRDWNRDGTLDYVSIDPIMRDVRIEVGDGQGSLAEPLPFEPPSASWDFPVLGWYSADGIGDLAYLTEAEGVGFSLGAVEGFLYSPSVYVGYSGTTIMDVLHNEFGDGVVIVSEANGGEVSVVFPTLQ